jgi:hypothetical protein
LAGRALVSGRLAAADRRRPPVDGSPLLHAQRRLEAASSRLNDVRRFVRLVTGFSLACYCCNWSNTACCRHHKDQRAGRNAGRALVNERVAAAEGWRAQMARSLLLHARLLPEATTLRRNDVRLFNRLATGCGLAGYCCHWRKLFAAVDLVAGRRDRCTALC